MKRQNKTAWAFWFEILTGLKVWSMIGYDWAVVVVFGLAAIIYSNTPSE